MTTRRVQYAQDYAWVTREAVDQAVGNLRADVERRLVGRCQAAIAEAGLKPIPSRPHTCHWQTQMIPLHCDDPVEAKPWAEGDIIPEGWHALWLAVVTVAAYDPREEG
jgi:hypothetical protein